ncbi:MAG: 30S ribosomal protein S8 [Candidatus Woesearchaeota archaeon]
MSLNDPLANTLSKIQNAENLVKKEVKTFPSSKLIKNVLILLKDNLFIGDTKEFEDDKGNYIIINLIGRINKIKAIKPRFTVKSKEFEKYEKRYLPSKDFGIIIVSTSKGLMTHKQAIEKNLGGRLIAFCY